MIIGSFSIRHVGISFYWVFTGFLLGFFTGFRPGVMVSRQVKSQVTESFVEKEPKPGDVFIGNAIAKRNKKNIEPKENIFLSFFSVDKIYRRPRPSFFFGLFFLVLFLLLRPTLTENKFNPA